MYFALHKQYFKKKSYTYSALISLLFLFSFGVVLSQTDKKISNFYKAKIQKADDYFNKSDYIDAIEIYKDILSKVGDDTTIICKIGDSYRLLNDSKNAEEWYRKVLPGNEKNVNPNYLLYFGQVLTANNKYDEAIYWYKEYFKARSNDPRALESIKSLENLSNLYYDTTFYIVYPLNINTEFSEFSPAFYKNGIFFISDRASKKSGFTSWYKSDFNASGELLTPKKYDNPFKTEYNEGPVAFYGNYSKMIFSQNYFKGKANKKDITEVPLQLFMTRELQDNKWESPEILPFVDSKYSYAQPTVTEDGTTLYFSSNLPGGDGGADIYKSEYKGDRWSEPVNMGNTINTPGDEMFPFIFQDSILFFSSNGHGGLGGLDIFRINLKDTGRIENMGLPINSSKDDFGFILDKDGLSGYISSNRPNGKGADDIYGFKQIRISITIKIIDEITKLPVSNAEVFSLNNENEPIGITDKNGSCTLVIPVCEVFKVKVKKENYESKVYSFQETKPLANPVAVISIQTDTKEKIVLTDENDSVIENPKNVIYKVQILASRKPARNKELKRKYSGPLKITKFEEDHWHKYSIGEFSSYKEAKECLIDCNVNDAFIIAYVNRKKVYITIAKSATNETNVLSPITRDDLKK